MKWAFNQLCRPNSLACTERCINVSQEQEEPHQQQQQQQQQQQDKH